MIAYGNYRYLTNVEKFSTMLKLLNHDSIIADKSRLEESLNNQIFIQKDLKKFLYENNSEMN